MPRGVKYPVQACPMDLFIIDADGWMVGRTPIREHGVEVAGFGWMSTAVYNAWCDLWDHYDVAGLSATAAANLLNQINERVSDA